MIVEKCRRMDLLGIDPETAHDPSKQIPLDAVYTALMTTSKESSDLMLTGKKADREIDYSSALDQLNKSKYLVLLGDPGSGKSTFVNIVGLCLAGEALKNKELNLKFLTRSLPDKEEKKKKQEWKCGLLFPLKIVLREFAARGLPPENKDANLSHLWD